MPKPPLTKLEAEALLAAAGNIDPCMFDEMPKGGAALARAWRSGQDKLRDMIAAAPAAAAAPAIDHLPAFARIKRLALDCRPAEVPDALAHIVRICIDAERATVGESRKNPRTDGDDGANALKFFRASRGA